MQLLEYLDNRVNANRLNAINNDVLRYPRKKLPSSNVVPCIQDIYRNRRRYGGLTLLVVVRTLHSCLLGVSTTSLGLRILAN